MNLSRRYWFALHPDLNRPVGGVKQIHRLAEAVIKSGREAFLIQDDPNFHPGWFSSNIATISKDRWSQLTDLNPVYDTVVLPETFILGLQTYSHGLPTIIFNQNGSYTFGTHVDSAFMNPKKILQLYHSEYLSHVMCVSHHDYRLLTSGLSIPSSKVSLIVNGLESNLFKPSSVKKRQIAFMPRKNTRDCQIVLSLLSNKSWLSGWKLKSIDRFPQHRVSSILQDSLLFLSFGHPEGFGLPVAEALASGCGVIGYSGLGGKELFLLANKFQVAKEIAYGDWFGFVDATYDFVKAFDRKPTLLLSALRSCSKVVRSKYSEEQMFDSVVSALNKYESLTG